LFKGIIGITKKPAQKPPKRDYFLYIYSIDSLKEILLLLLLLLLLLEFNGCEIVLDHRPINTHHLLA